MRKKYRLILIVSIIGLLVTLSTGTYAFMRTTLTQTTTNRIVAIDCLDITYESLSDGINLDGAYPITDKEGQLTVPYSFKIKNNCETLVAAVINLETLKETTLDLQYIKISLNKEIPELLSSKAAGERYYSASVSSGSKKLLTVILSQDEEREYDLRLWVNQSATKSEMGKLYKGKIIVLADAMVVNSIERPNWNTTSGSLLEAIKTGKYIYANPMTTPGRGKSSNTEGVLASKEDDYGTSYYFRGNVDDNFVVFANMCWRIVRITGDSGDEGDYNKAIKLVLYNYNPHNLFNPCAEMGNTLAFARYEGSNYKTQFSVDGTYNAYVGYMYGNKNGTTYDDVHKNTNRSIILNNLIKWYNNYLLAYSEDYLADTIWCNDKSLAPEGYQNALNTGIGSQSTYYSGHKRLAVNSTSNPILKCPDANGNDKNLSRFTARDVKYGNGALNFDNIDYKIGLLTTDEIALAGSAYNVENTIYYLWNNTREGWWTLTPYNNGGIILFHGNGYWATWNAKLSLSLRPSISLKASVKVNPESDGTANNPYVIQESSGE